MAPAAVVERICAKAAQCDQQVVAATLQLAREIACEGHEGARVGALFTIGRPDAVLELSQPLILDPLWGHAPISTHITDAKLRGTIKALAQLDGAFVIADDGTVVAACRHLHASGAGVQVPLGLGARHHAAAAISKELDILAVVVSQSGAIRVFCAGDLLIEFQAGATSAEARHG